jgi:predicted DNA-binding protein (UPF0278 family)
MNYNDYRDDVIAELAAVLAKHGCKIRESEDCEEWIISGPPTDRAKRAGCSGLYLYVHDVANHMYETSLTVNEETKP